MADIAERRRQKILARSLVLDNNGANPNTKPQTQEQPVTTSQLSTE